MLIKLANGTELTPLDVHGERKMVQNEKRDTLIFIFPAKIGLETIDGLFTAENCENIAIADDEGTEFIHTGYIIRVSLLKDKELVEYATSETEAVYVELIKVTMAERTYSESLLAKVAQESVDTQLAVAELAELVAGGAE